MADTSDLPPFAARSYDFLEYVPARNFIGGKWRDAQEGETLAVMNPRHGRPMSSVAMSGAADADAAVQAAARAWPAWRAVPFKERAQVFYRLKVLMERDLQELAWLASHENGKTHAEAIAGRRAVVPPTPGPP